MQQLAAGHLGQRIELFCPFHPGCPRAKVFWTKDGVRLVESGLSTISINSSGGLVIEVEFLKIYDFIIQSIKILRTIKRMTTVTIHVL